jgi:transposase-like protein
MYFCCTLVTCQNIFLQSKPSKKPDGLTVFAFPASHQRKLRTTNGLERLNREIHRRTSVVGIFPNEASCLRLTSAILMEYDDDWQVGRIYLTFQDGSEPPQSY